MDKKWKRDGGIAPGVGLYLYLSQKSIHGPSARVLDRGEHFDLFRSVVDRLEILGFWVWENLNLVKGKNCIMEEGLSDMILENEVPSTVETHEISWHRASYIVQDLVIQMQGLANLQCEAKVVVGSYEDQIHPVVRIFLGPFKDSKTPNTGSKISELFDELGSVFRKAGEIEWT